jgi:hypothetical protein
MCHSYSAALTLAANGLTGQILTKKTDLNYLQKSGDSMGISTCFNGKIARSQLPDRARTSPVTRAPGHLWPLVLEAVGGLTNEIGGFDWE